MAGPGIPLNLGMEFYRPPSRPSTPAASRGFPVTHPSSILNPPASTSTSTSGQPAGARNINTTTGSVPASGPYARSAPSNAEPAFEFTVPSLPPRLANFGRKISQMSTDFMAEFEDAPSTRSSSDLPRAGADAVPGMGDEPVMCPFCEKPLPPALFAGHTHGHGAANHQAVKTTSSLAGPGLKRSNTTTAVQTRASLRNEGAKRAGLLDALPVQQQVSSSSAKPQPAIKEENSPSLTISAEEMRREEAEADGTNASSSKVAVSDEDIRRWSRLAGIDPPKVSKLPHAAGGLDAKGQVASVPVGDVPVPRLDPPPASGRPSTSRASSSSSRFGFFGRKATAKKEVDAGDDSDEEGGQASGYSRLLAGGSDTESDGEGDEDDTRIQTKSRKQGEREKLEILHDEPGHMTPEEGAVAPPGAGATSSAKEVQETAAETSPEDLKNVLREVLSKLNEMSQSHAALHSSQTSLLTSLKIARSNLVMAEANTEMLEAQLKQQQKVTSSPAPVSASGSAQPRTAGVPATPLAQPRAVPASATIPGRTDYERQNHRPMSLQMPAGTSAPEKGGWGFWNNGKKKLQDAAQAFPANFPSPTMEKRSFEFDTGASATTANGYTGVKSKEINRLSSEGAGGMVRSASYSNLDSARSPPRTSSLAQNASSSSASAHTAELAKVRELYATAEKKIDAMSKELAELKKGKVEMEAELENLSQALFEEANKMVADERKKRAEVEEALKEVKDEREALKQTIKVLDGRSSAADDAASVRSVKSSRSVPGEGASPQAEEDLPDEFVPRDLDKHYEALRRSIHHVSDGATDTEPGGGLISALSVPETIPESRDPSSGPESRAEPAEQADDSGVATGAIPAVAPPLDPNPWANPSPFGASESSGPEPDGKLPGEDQLRVRSSDEAPRSRSPVEDLDRLMQRLQEDMKD